MFKPSTLRQGWRTATTVARVAGQRNYSTAIAKPVVRITPATETTKPKYSIRADWEEQVRRLAIQNAQKTQSPYSDADPLKKEQDRVFLWKQKSIKDFDQEAITSYADSLARSINHYITSHSKNPLAQPSLPKPFLSVLPRTSDKDFDAVAQAAYSRINLIKLDTEQKAAIAEYFIAAFNAFKAERNSGANKHKADLWQNPLLNTIVNECAETGRLANNTINIAAEEAGLRKALKRGETQKWLDMSADKRAAYGNLTSTVAAKPAPKALSEDKIRNFASALVKHIQDYAKGNTTEVTLPKGLETVLPTLKCTDFTEILRHALETVRSGTLTTEQHGRTSQFRLDAIQLHHEARNKLSNKPVGHRYGPGA